MISELIKQHPNLLQSANSPSIFQPPHIHKPPADSFLAVVNANTGH